MATILIVAFYVCAISYVYHGIIAPSIRDELRYQLFALRDRLRWLRHDHGAECSEELFLLLDEGISRWINRLPLLTLSLMVKLELKMESDREFQKAVKHSRRLIAECGLAEVDEIVRDMNRVFDKALVCNTLGWVPLVLLALWVSSTVRRIRTAVSDVALIRNDQAAGLSPDFAYA